MNNLQHLYNKFMGDEQQWAVGCEAGSTLLNLYICPIKTNTEEHRSG